MAQWDLKKRSFTQVLQKRRKCALQKAHAVSQCSSSLVRMTSVHVDEATTEHLINLARNEPEVWKQVKDEHRSFFQGFHQVPEHIRSKCERIFHCASRMRQPVDLPDPGMDVSGPGGMRNQPNTNQTKMRRKTQV